MQMRNSWKRAAGVAVAVVAVVTVTAGCGVVVPLGVARGLERHRVAVVVPPGVARGQDHPRVAVSLPPRRRSRRSLRTRR